MERFNIAQQPGTFAEREPVRKALAKGGEPILPVIMLDGHTVSQGRYPSRQELASWTNLVVEQGASLFSEAAAELIAIGASIAADCEPCFKSHFDRARNLLGSCVEPKRLAHRILGT